MFIAIDKKTQLFNFLSFLTVILYVYVGYTSYGFDDEFFNIGIVENFSTYEIIFLDASVNLNHPNGSLFLNSILFNIFGDWSYVRSFYGLIFALCLLFSFKCLTNENKNFNQFFFILLCLNPSLLMLGSSLRWYSIFIIFINLLIILIYKNYRNPAFFWGSFLCLAQALIYTNYLAFLILPISFFYTLNQRKFFFRENKNEILYLTLFIFLSLVIAFPEIKSFLYKLSLDQSNQTSPFLWSVTGFGIFQTSGIALMPFSYPGIFSIILAQFILMTFLLNFRTEPIKFLYIYVFICSFIILSGIGGKFRAFFTIHILDAYIKAQILSFIPKRFHYLIFIILLAPFLIGSINVVTHDATSKGSWNLPYSDTIEEVGNLAAFHECQNLQIFLHDPGLTWHLTNLEFKVVNIYSLDNVEQLSLNSKADCQMYLKTYRGSMDPQRKNTADTFFNSKPGLVKKIYIKRDKFSSFKKTLDEDIPGYYVELYVYK
jgi:hypothetical protein